MRKDWMKGKVGLGIVLLMALAGFMAGVAPARASDEAAKAGAPPALNTKEERASYAIGVETGRNFKRQGIEVDPDIVGRGIKDAMTGGKLLLTDEELLDLLNRFAGELRAKRGTERMLAALDNKKEGEAFLAENKTKKDVVTLPSGLQYKVIKAGNGKKPTEADTVEISYRGTLINGTEFANTTSTGPVTLQISDNLKLIAGLREALKLMPVGSKWQLFIPHTLAYLERGSGQYIGPNSTLIYELELTAIK
jgi:FKBP-type peptidyl-prolyl cis-trans isomerase FklB